MPFAAAVRFLDSALVIVTYSSYFVLCHSRLSCLLFVVLLQSWNGEIFCTLSADNPSRDCLIW